MSSATTIVAAMNTLFANVAGITSKNVYAYEPTNYNGASALLYTVLRDVRRSRAGGKTILLYRFYHRIILQDQGTGVADAKLLELVNTIPAAIDADPQLDGAIPNGNALIADAVAGYVTASNVKYRELEFTSEVRVEVPFQMTGI